MQGELDDLITSLKDHKSKIETQDADEECEDE